MKYPFQATALTSVLLAVSLGTPLTLVASGAPSDQDSETPQWRAPKRKSRVKNPFPSTPTTIAKGKALFEKSCVACHGDLGKGDGAAAPFLQVHPRDLSSSIMWEQTDGELYWKISAGRTPMPAFETLHTSEERWMIVDYIRTLAPKPLPKLTAPLAGHIMDTVVDSYAAVRAGLAADDTKTAIANVSRLSLSIASLELVKPGLIPKAYVTKWKTSKATLKAATAALEKAKTTQTLRTAFAKLSTELVPVITELGYGGKQTVRVIDCKMAFKGAGATWIQKGKLPANPYLGQEMPTCGTERTTIKKATLPKSE